MSLLFTSQTFASLSSMRLRFDIMQSEVFALEEKCNGLCFCNTMVRIGNNSGTSKRGSCALGIHTIYSQSQNFFCASRV